MPDPQEASFIKTIRTPNLAERSVVLYVPEKLFKDSTPVEEGMTMREFLPKVEKGDARDRGFLPYLLNMQIESDREGYHAFTFVKPKTAKERMTPFHVETVKKPYPWPDWLRSLFAIQDPEVPIEIVTKDGSTFHDRVFPGFEFIDGGNFESEILIEEFFSPEPFPVDELHSESPQPTTINIDYLGAGLNLSCLHPKVKVPRLRHGGRQVFGFGTPNARQRYLAGDVYEATNMPGWIPHIFFNDTERRPEGWYRMQKTVTPMYIPKSNAR